MPSNTVRIAVAVAVLASLLGISAVPANAQPSQVRAAMQAETSPLELLWQWVSDFCLSADNFGQTKSFMVDSDLSPSISSGATLNRGGTMDPNG
jgi:hypothetical protein